ncbi:type II toxin-antitoxin system RelE/ParE family toxin [Paenibacillus alkaliterrae]|uniref:type II toxin-antitoxin system RelE/ParE family toxin n=1 Tax=Paenibacillus alkaliterrae TaxID=320909 RepID=UPI001F1598C1|nr:type II toxin-antitoxin system RelE/ParE family toxin [Paenibacillus alkaliterrae]MCF2939750.1 type II toxin-antitoxin system RelE/ParE family toxin [Paenibacillus alkaliterrae]
MENANRSYTVIISDKASAMLVSHARFLAQVSVEAAQNLIDDFKASAKSLERLPDRNPWLSDSALPINKYRKLLLCKRYLLIYQIKDSMVFVDYVVDCRQDYGWLL